MKKKISKLFKSSAKPPETGGRITNETVAEHRERVLAGGRKFKYPVQYTKHRILFMSIVIGVLAILVFVAFFVYQLYFAQAYDKFTYGLTRVIPVPIAKVDNEWVRYSDYLLELRSSVHYLTTKEATNFNSADGKRQLDYQKRLALDKAERDAYVAKLASDNKITVSTDEVNAFVKRQIDNNKLGVKEDIYKQVISDYYDWTFDEYKNSIRQELLGKKVNAALDTEDKNKIQQVLQQIQGGGDFAAIAKAQSEDVITKNNGGDVGFASKNSDDPNGLIAAAGALQPGQVSGVIEGTDGFYIIKLYEKRDNGDVHFAKIFISYKFVNQKLAELKSQNKINEFVTINQNVNSINQ